ncbi:MAG: DNA polymerase III subunit delta [Gaiella sp.]
MAEVELKPVYLITGSDRPKIEGAIARLRRHFDPTAVEQVSAVDVSGGDAAALCNSGSLFGDRRLVIVSDIDGRPNAEGQLRGGWKAGDVTDLTAYLKSPAPDTVLALVATALKKDAPLAKASAKAGDVLAFDVAKRGLQQWVAERFRTANVRAESDACAALVHLVGDDLHALANEVEKIATWAGDEPVGEREVEQLVAASSDTPLYTISDAWGARDIGRALGAAEAFLERSGRPPAAAVPMIANQLARHATTVRHAKRLEQAQIPAREATKELGVRFDFQAQRAYEHSRNFGDGELDTELVRLARLDHALKGGSRLSSELELTRALADGNEPKHG